MAAEIADGLLPHLFYPEKVDLAMGEPLKAGLARRDASLGPLNIVAGGMLAIGEGPETKALLDFARPIFALYVGGMGAKGKNFYNDLACAYGYEKEAAEIQDLYLSGKKKEAEALVPDRVARGRQLRRSRVLHQGADRGLRRGRRDQPQRHPGRRGPGGAGGPAQGAGSPDHSHRPLHDTCPP